MNQKGPFAFKNEHLLHCNGEWDEMMVYVCVCDKDDNNKKNYIIKN